MLLVLACLACAAPTGAIVAKIDGRGYGVTPIGGANPASPLAGSRRLGVIGSGARGTRSLDELPEAGSPLTYHGGPVMHSNETHVIYWDPNKEFTARTKEIIDGFFTNVAHDSGLASNVFGVDAQYTDSTANAAYDSTFGGERVDEHTYPSTGNCSAPTKEADLGPYTKCLFDSQLQAELSQFITNNSLPKGSSQLYFLLLPHKVATCFNQTKEEEEKHLELACSNNVFCAYHSYVAPGTPSEIIYAAIPFSLLDTEVDIGVPDAKGCQFDRNSGIQQPNPDNAGGKNSETRFGDVALKYISHEYSEAITDPLVGVETAWVDAEEFENGDKCNATQNVPGETAAGIDEHAYLPTLGGEASEDNLFDQSINGGSYYLQSEWDNVAEACLMKPLPISGADFTVSTSSTVVGAPVGFEGSATDPYGELGFAWNFGDGSTGAGASPTHAYTAAGQYTVTMTPEDALTGAAPPVSHTVTVTAPPPPPTKVEPTIAVTAASAVAAVIQPNGTVTLAGTTITIGANGAGQVRLSCTGNATCSGKLTLTVKVKGKNRRTHTVTLGGASFSIAAGTTGAVTLKLTAAGRSRLRAAHGHLSAGLTIVKSSPAPASTQTRTVRLKLKLKK